MAKTDPMMASGQEPDRTKGTHMEAVMQTVNDHHAKHHGLDQVHKQKAIDQPKEVARGTRKPSETGNL